MAGSLPFLLVVLTASAALALAGCQENPVSPTSPNETGEGSHSESGTEPSSGSSGEPGESGTQYGLADTAKETRAGVDLTIRYDATSRGFVGTVQNTTTQTAQLVRVEIHLSNGVELGPTPPADLAAGTSRPVTLSAAGQQFNRWSVHIELGQGEQ